MSFIAKIILCLSVFSFSFGNNFISLNINKAFFEFDENIYSSDINANIKKFLISKVPKNTNNYKIPFVDLKQIFASHHINIKNKTNNKYISFSKKLLFDKDKIKTFISQQYTQAYKDIKIQAILLKYYSYIDLSKYSMQDISLLNKKSLQQKGSVKVSFVSKDDRQTKSLFVKYTIKATIPYVVAIEDLPKGTLLTNHNTQIQYRELSVNTQMLNTIKPNIFYAKHFIKNSTVIKALDLKRKYMIKRKSKIIVVYNSYNIQAQRSAIAMQNGYLGDFINIKMNNRQLKAKIISANKVEIQ